MVIGSNHNKKIMTKNKELEENDVDDIEEVVENNIEEKVELKDSLIETKKIKEDPSIKNKSGSVKLKLKNIRMIGTWDYGCDNKECYLCHSILQLPIRTNNKLCSDVIIGECNHGFHRECMTRWIANGNNKCPYCNINWKNNQTVSSKVYIYTKKNI